MSGLVVLAELFGCLAMRFRRIFVMFGRLSVMDLRHNSSSEVSYF